MSAALCTLRGFKGVVPLAWLRRRARAGLCHPLRLFGMPTYAIAVPTRFRGLAERQGMVWRGAAGWAEWSPFLDYDGAELVPWLRAADEASEQGWPPPVRTVVEVNSIVPAVGPEPAFARAQGAGCRTAKVKVAVRGESLADDLARVEAVRDALGPDGRIRV